MKGVEEGGGKKHKLGEMLLLKTLFQRGKSCHLLSYEAEQVSHLDHKVD